MTWFIRLWVTSNATQQESCFQLEDWRSFVSFEHILWTPSLQSHVWSTNRYIVLLARAWPPHPLSLGYQMLRRKYFTVRDLACQQKFGKILKHCILITLSDWKTQHHSSSATAHQPINHVKIIWYQLILIQTWNMLHPFWNSIPLNLLLKICKSHQMDSAVHRSNNFKIQLTWFAHSS